VVSEPAVESTGSPAPSNAPSVPMLPAVPSALSRCRINPVVVVFPFVPVTPTSVSARAGCPYHTAPRASAARRPSRTTISGTPESAGASTITAPAPRRTASGTNR
jgi:hypothetical protein